jgi:adenylate kinase
MVMASAGRQSEFVHHPLTVVLLGPQGSGKGTQAKLLAARHGFVHLEMGQLLRAAAKAETEEGRELDRLINHEGVLAPLPIAMATFRRALEAVQPDQSVIFDGTPRRREEVVYWDRELPKLGRAITHVIALELSEANTIERLSKRRVCERDGRPFILGVDLKDEGSPCPVCGGRVIQRTDDQPEAIRRRLATYRAETEPVLSEYRPRGLVRVVNGDQPIETIYEHIESLLRS